MIFPLCVCVCVCVRVALQGHKRRAVEAGSVPASRGHRGKRRRVPLRARYGLNAWRRWALSPADQSHDPKDQDSTTPGEQAPPPKHDSVDIATLFCQRLHQLPVHGQCKMSSQPYLCYRPCYQGYCGSNEVLLHCEEIENKL